MRINEYHVWAFFIGLAVGCLLTRWQMNNPNALISRVEHLVRDTYSRMETLAMFINLTPGQNKRISAGPPLVDLDELFDYYRWALHHRFDAHNDEPLTNSWLGLNTDKPNKRKTLDVTALAALAIICEKLLGLTRVHAIYAMLRGKQANDYKWLLPPKEPPAPSP
jgi:hypothetical protein